MRLEIKNPKRIEEMHSLLPDFQFNYMSIDQYMFSSNWKAEQWRITINRWQRNSRNIWEVEVRLVSKTMWVTINVTHTILSNITFFKAYIAKEMGEIWKTYLNSVI